MKIKSIAIDLIQKKALVKVGAIAIFLAIAVLAPLLKQQFITGLIVNAVLFISVMLLGNQGAILVGLVPSLIALSAGLLPIVLAPMIPFIMLGNTILIITFDYFKKKSYWLGIIIASFLKFLFLFLASSVVANLIIKKEIASKVAVMMSWPQLLTALTGGVIAYLFLKTIKKI